MRIDIDVIDYKYKTHTLIVFVDPELLEMDGEKALDEVYVQNYINKSFKRRKIDYQKLDIEKQDCILTEIEYTVNVRIPNIGYEYAI